MENFRKKFLLGINKGENKIYFGEIEITTRNNYKEFTANFNIGEAFDIDEIDESYKNDYKESYWDCLDAQTKLNCLDDGELTKYDFFENWEIFNDDYRDFKDCSCTDFEVTLINSQTINFETIGCGQCDIRENKIDFENITFTNKEAVLLILDLWDKYHITNVENNIKDVENKINKILKKLDKYNSREFENIENFIKKHIKEV